MKKFLVLYKSSTPASEMMARATAEQMQSGMEDWNRWAAIATNAIVDLGSPVGAFIRDRCVVGVGHRAWVDDLYNAWKGWCEQDGRNAVSTKQAFGRLDVLFNNAGVGAPGINLEDLTYEQWKNVVDINLTGAFLCTQEAFKLMKIIDGVYASAKSGQRVSLPFKTDAKRPIDLWRS